jgi:uncharacterized membrane protein YdjX (TVP38/TMEM64 family)
MAMRAPPVVRIAILVAVVLALALAAQLSGLTAWLTRERVQALAEHWGVLGVLAYVVLFALAEIAQLPGALFVLAAVAAYGPWSGALIAYFGMNVASLATFLFGRAVAGRALVEVTHPRVKALVAQIEHTPVRSTAFARGVLFVLPGIGYALALSPVRVRDYVLGSAIGLVVPTLLAAVGGAWLLSLVP